MNLVEYCCYWIIHLTYTNSKDLPYIAFCSYILLTRNGVMFSLQRWTTALCRSDYDGDGKTNGEELGDPFCIWEKGKYFVHDFTVCY